MTTTREPPVSFGRWLKQLRSRQALTQEALAELANCSVQAIRFFESGKRRPSLEMAIHLAALFQIPAIELDAFLQVARQPIDAVAQAEESVTEPVVVPTSAPAQMRLPALEHALVGREGERAILRQLLLGDQQRLVTLAGAGGMGKTHLALDVATALAPVFRHGAAFVQLAVLQSAQQLPSAVAAALQLTLGAGDPSKALLDQLATRHLLLLLDGFEPLLNRDAGAATDWVNHLLQRAPQVQLLVTSRERLRLSGERIFELGGLSLPSQIVPPEASEAMMLFLNRAQLATGNFRLDAQNKMAVARICQLVDGMPLGIELAAAWVRALTPAEIAEELARNVDFLARANRDTPARHGSMRAIFAHSWDMLDANEQGVLMRLAIFRGGCSREAANAVAGATLGVLASLIDKSLVRRIQTTAHARYDLHEVIRQFAFEKLRLYAESTPNLAPSPVAPATVHSYADVQAAHYTYFAQLADTARQRLQGNEQLHWLRILDEEHTNLWAALDRCLADQDFVRGLRLIVQLEDYWYIRGHHSEGLDYILRLMALVPPPQTLLEQAPAYAAACLFAIGGGDYTAARHYSTLSIADARATNDLVTLGRVLRYLGIIHLREQNLAAAHAEFSEAMAINQQIGAQQELAITLSHLAEIALLQQQHAQAQTVGEQAVQLLRTTQNKNQLAGSLRRLAQAHSHQGHVGPARHYALESLDLNSEVGDRRGTAASMIVLATLLAHQAQWPLIGQLLGAADALLAQSQAHLLPADQVEYEQIHTACLQYLGESFPAAHAAGRARVTQRPLAPCDVDWIKQLLAEEVV